MLYRTGTALLLTALLACGGALPGNKDSGKEIQAALVRTLQASARPSFVTQDREGARLWKLTRQFYEMRGHAPAWIERNATPRSNMEALTNSLREAWKEGLDPELYGLAALERKRQAASKGFLSEKGFDVHEAGALDVWMTYLYLKYASDLADGLSDLALADRTWQIKPERFDPLARLQEALQQNRVAESLLELTPRDTEYRMLRKALADHRAQAGRGGWPTVPAHLTLRPGATSPHVPALARRLAASGDFKGPVPADGKPAVYDEALRDAVKRFQRRHGLPDDGVVTRTVAAELNVPIEERIRLIELNLERWRWLPREPGRRYILVNIPDMRLEVREEGRIPLAMRVVAGKRDTPTPVFNDQMTHIVFSPYWNVPPNIAEEETLPASMRDPGFLARNNMEVVDASGRTVDPESVDWSDPGSFRFRQRPGSSNALGLIKFMFPNHYDVYLHDTPQDSLFGRAARLFSHGCVRVERPEALAAFVLRDQPEWTADRIKAAMHAGEERTVKLREPIPVFIGYWTARVTPDGLVQFRRDVYGIDARLAAMREERMRRLRSSSTAGAPAAVRADPRVAQSGK